MEKQIDQEYSILLESKSRKITELNSYIKILKDHIADLSKKIENLIDTNVENQNLNDNDNKHYREIIEKLERKVDLFKRDNSALEYKIVLQNHIIENPECEKRRDVLCIICEENVRNVLFRPCNHLVMCDTCSGKSSYDECFICKQSIESYEYAYLV